MAKRDQDGILPVSRRELAALVTVAVAFAAAPVQAAVPRASRPVVGFHNDAPWLDMSGHDTPYHPPTATGRFAPDSESLMRIGFFL